MSVGVTGLVSEIEYKWISKALIGKKKKKITQICVAGLILCPTL